MRGLIVAAAAALSSINSAQADDLAIFSAAAVRPALIQLPPLFAKATGHHVTVSFGNAAAIHSKVIAGERVDVVILPPRQLTALIDGGHLAAETRTDLGVVRLGIATRGGKTAMPVATTEQFKQAMLSAASFGMPDPADGSTSSQHLVKILQELGIADAMRSKTRYFKDGTQALLAVAQGEITLTIAPTTSIRVVPGVQLVGLLPTSLQSVALYSAALSRASLKSGGAAGALLSMLRSQEFAALMRDKGIDPP